MISKHRPPVSSRRRPPAPPPDHRQRCTCHAAEHVREGPSQAVASCRSRPCHTRGRRAHRARRVHRGREAPRAQDQALLRGDGHLAFAADPERVRGRLRCHGRGRPGGDRVRVGARGSGIGRIRARAGGRPPARPSGLRGHHGRRPRGHGGCQPGVPRGGWPVGRLQHRAAPRAGPQPLRGPGHRVPVLLRTQGDVRQVRRCVRHPAWWLRHARRAVRGAHAHPDRQGAPLPGHSSWAPSTGPACSTGCARCLSHGAPSARRTWSCSWSPTTRPRWCAPSPATRPRTPPRASAPRTRDWGRAGPSPRHRPPR